MRSCSVVVILVLWLTILSSVESAPRCTSCLNEECPPPENCQFGVVKNYCGRDTCAKGPGQRCGGKWNYHGTCGDGLICSCQRCTGCSLRTLDCYNGPCI